MNQSSTVYVGMDVHKDSIEIALADAGEVRRYGRSRVMRARWIGR